MNVRLSSLAVLSLLLLAGCGNKGPLYLPSDEDAAKDHSKDIHIFGPDAETPAPDAADTEAHADDEDE